MKVSELLELRRRNWQELERLCAEMENRRKRTMGAPAVARFAALYRAACADLALAESHQLPPNTVQYLHRLVGRAHNQLYRSRRFNLSHWAHLLAVEVPQRVFHDRCVQVAFLLFWGVFIASAYLAATPRFWPDFAERVLTQEVIDRLHDHFSEPPGRDGSPMNPVMAAFYIQHNTSIGLQCFALGLMIVPGLYVLIFNAAHLGAAFGYMARPEVTEGNNFYNFVTAHGPFELTAIVLSAGAGLRLGLAWIAPRRWRRSGEEEDPHAVKLTRLASLRATAEEAMPLMGSAMVLFFFAALIEGFLSPTSAPYWIKAAVAVLSSGLLMFYFVVLGFPRRTPGAT